jgi:hypothetical protein
MAAPAIQGGSLPRMYLALNPTGNTFLAQSYLRNNLFVYPEHQDHDIGFNGIDGWGDLFPANHPALIVSQGSSFTDMPFLKALLATAAALRPEIQENLIKKNILIPTLHAIFRKANKSVQKNEDYFTGKAHPVVFEGSQIDDLKMVQAAQLLSPMSVPPLAFLEVLSETPSTPGLDFFDRATVTSTKLSESPLCISRIFRGTQDHYEMRVSAKRSVDAQSKPLKFRWVLLQGDSAAIEILPSDDGVEANLRLRWHDGIASSVGTSISTHRVDIGVFASSPLADSVPAIVSFYLLPNEKRFFDEKGWISEICYAAGNPDLGLPRAADDPRWISWIETALGLKSGLGTEWVGPRVTDAQRRILAQAWKDLRPLRALWLALQDDPEKKQETAEAEATLRTAIRAATARDLGTDETLPQMAERIIRALADREDLYLEHQSEILHSGAPGLVDLQKEIKQLSDWGVLLLQNDGTQVLTPAQATRQASSHYYLRQLHLTLLSQVILPDFLKRSTAPAFVDARLTAPKAWRDVYLYDDQGKRSGWLRYQAGKVTAFTADGRMKQSLSDPAEAAVPVSYVEREGKLSFDAR